MGTKNSGGEAEEWMRGRIEQETSEQDTSEPQSGSVEPPPVIAHPTSCSEDDGPTPQLVFGNSYQVNLISKGVVTEEGKVYEESQTHSSGEHTYTTRPQNVPTSTAVRDVRDDKGIGIAIPQPSQPPGPVRKFQNDNGSGLPTPVLDSTVPDIQALVNANPHKAGIAFLCVSTGDPRSGDFIANCTALEKMEDCLGTKLGYLTISVGTNMTTSQLDSLISQLATLKLPEKYKRVIAYFFGHGNDDSLQFADGFVERQHIISKFQLISPTNENLFKIFIFDSCRMVNSTTCEGIQESSGCKALAGESWKAKGQYPESVNTLVINATTCNNKAYYRDIDGCGLLTTFFTELAPTRNESLRDLLAVIRQKIAHETQMETLKTTQILVYEDKVMGIINLLAESQGTARVAPTQVSASPSILSTNVHWRFDDKVQAQIQQFEIEITSVVCTKLPGDRMATISGLASGTDHSVRVIAVYKDGTKAESEMNEFTTPVRDCPSTIEVMTEYPGSPRAKIMWCFAGESSDLTQFRVELKPEGKEMTTCDVPSTKRETFVSGLLPLKTHQISVSAVYQDGIEMKENTQFTHSGRSSPDNIEVTPDFDGSPHALAEWTFEGVIQDLSYFCVLVEAEGRNIFETRVTKDEKKAMLSGLLPSTKNKVSVMAEYTDGIQTHNSVDIVYDDRYCPEDIKITQEVPGSSTATVEWSFPECATSALSHFCLFIKKKENEEGIVENRVASQERQVHISCLDPSTKYTVTIVAEYSDGIKRESCVEHTNCELQAAEIHEESTQLTGIREGWAAFTIEWNYQHNEPLLEVDHFKVMARPTSTNSEPENEVVTVDCDCRTAQVELQLGTTYSLSVETYFKCSSIKPQKSKEIQISAPTAEEVIPSPEVLGERKTNRATFTIPHPPILDEHPRLVLSSIRYAVREVPHNGDDGPNQSEQGADFVDFYQRNSTGSGLASPVQQPPDKITVDRLTPGKTYKIKLRAAYNGGGFVESREVQFQTRPYTVCEKACRCCVITTLCAFFVAIFIMSLLFASSYPTYATILQRQPHSRTDYTLTLDTVQCGAANSLFYGGIRVEGTLKTGDTLQGVIQAWRVNDKHLKLYPEPQPPVIDGGFISQHERLILNGWQIYTWKHSIISGYCCIENNATTEQTASLYLFTSDQDVTNFNQGERARNAILSDTITIPPKSLRCFSKWGPKAPFIVSRNSYHFFGIDAPGNSNFTSNITVMQMKVNTSDFGTPQYFRFDNSTHFPLPGHVFSRSKYIIICKAPLYESAVVANTMTREPQFESLLDTIKPRLGAESAHIVSTNEPHRWMKIALPITSALGVMGIIACIVVCVVCMCQRKCVRDRLDCYRWCCNQCKGYESLPSSNNIQY